jgi:hypothetical protein
MGFAYTHSRQLVLKVIFIPSDCMVRSHFPCVYFLSRRPFVFPPFLPCGSSGSTKALAITVTILPPTLKFVWRGPLELATTRVLPEADGLGSCIGKEITIKS